MKRTEAMAAGSHHDRSETPTLLDDLTPREREVLGLIGSGLSTAAIAAHLHRSQKTVKTHRLSLGRKLQVSNRVELARIAIQAGLSPIPGWPGEDIQALNEQLDHEIANRRKVESILRELDAATQATSGEAYFRNLVRHLAAALQVRGAYVGLVAGESKRSIQTLATWCDGAPDGNFEEALEGTVCEQVLRKGFFNVVADAVETCRLPSRYAALSIRNVIGCAMTDRFGLPVGVIVVLHDQPIDEGLHPESVLRILSGRANLELLHLLEGEVESQEDSVVNVMPHAPAPANGADAPPSAGRPARVVERPADDGIEAASAAAFAELSGASGEAVFRTLTTRLAELLNVNHVFLCESIGGPDRSVRILAAHTTGPFGAGDEYSLVGTPCEMAISDGICLFAGDVARQFPDDEVLEQMAIESYFGVALKDGDGAPIGVMNIMHEGRIDDPIRVKNALRMFASRAAIELDRHRMVERVKECTRFHHQLLEQVPGTMVYIDSEQRYQYVNDRYLQWLGLEREQVIGRTLDDILDEEVIEFTRPYLREVLAGKPLTYERRVVHSDTSASHWFSVTCTPDVAADGSIRGAFFMSMDITHEKVKDAGPVDDD